MEDGGHISGWLIEGRNVDMFDEKLEEYAAFINEKYAETEKDSMLYAIGDGNHALAAAKACYEELKESNADKDISDHPARYALVELENIHDNSQEFKAIHRIVTDINIDDLVYHMKNQICAEEGYPVKYYVCGKQEEIYLNTQLGEMPVAILQKFLDEYLKQTPEKVDYIHGENVLKELAEKENAIGFILPPIEKNQFFREIVLNGTLPKKTFSLGQAQEKRYYLEARKISCL